MNLRIRQVKPAFWTDGKIGRLPPATRLFYVGCWQIADDAGWFVCDVPEIGACLYPFDSPRLRERRIEIMLAELAAVGCVIVHGCGHGEVPHLVEHQRLAAAARRVETVHKAHLNQCPATFHTSPPFSTPATFHTPPPFSTHPRSRARDEGQSSSSEEGNGKVRGGVGGAAAIAASPETTVSETTTTKTTRRRPLAEVRDPLTGATTWVATGKDGAA